MQPVGSPRRRRTRGEGAAGVGNPVGDLDVVGARGSEGVGEQGIGRGTAVRGIVIIVGQFVAGAGHQPECAVEGGAIYVEGHSLPGGDGDGVVFHTAVGGCHNGGVRDGGGTGDRGVSPQVKGPGQRYRRCYTAVGGAVALDDVGRSTALARRAGIEFVRAAAAVEGVNAAAAIEDVGVSVTGDRVGMDRASDILDQGKSINAGSTAGRAGGQIDRHPRARARIVSRVDPGPAVQRVIAQGTDQDVVVIAAVQRVIAGAAVQTIVAGKAVDRIHPAQAADNVREGGAVDGLVRDIPADHDAAGGRCGNGLVAELEEFDVGHGHVLAVADDGAGLSGPGDGVSTAQPGEHDRVSPQAAVDDIRAGVGGEPVVGRVSAERV